MWVASKRYGMDPDNTAECLASQKLEVKVAECRNKI
jgi:hypothetical protein